MSVEQKKSSHDLRIYFARGMCLWFIFIDHTSSSDLSKLTPRNFLICDAADIFVFLSGLSAALAYGGKFDKFGWRKAAESILHRVRTIYFAHLALVAAVLSLCTIGSRFGSGEFAAIFSINAHEMSLGGFLRLALMVDRPWFAEILPLYIVLLICYAAILPLIRQPIILLVASGILWAAAYTTHMSYGVLGRFDLMFNPVAWQFIFVLGVFSGRASPLLHRVPPRPVDGLACCLLVAGVLSYWLLPTPDPTDPWEVYDHLWWPLKLLLRRQNKADLDPGRILSLLSLVWLVSRLVRRDAPWLNTRWAATFIALGRRSLPVFTVGILLSGLGEAVLRRAGGIGSDVLVNVIGLLGLVATARWFDVKHKPQAWLASREQRVP